MELLIKQFTQSVRNQKSEIIIRKSHQEGDKSRRSRTRRSEFQIGENDFESLAGQQQQEQQKQQQLQQ